MNTTPSNRSSNKGKDNHRKPSFPGLGGEDGTYTCQCKTLTADHGLRSEYKNGLNIKCRLQTTLKTVQIGSR